MKKFLRKILPESFILWTHKMRGWLAIVWYGNPSREIKVIGVTGTNGKTTTCHLISSILEANGAKVGMATTINFKIGKKNEENSTKMTTLNPFVLQKRLSEMKNAKCDYVIIETTSHAIAQYRNYGINYHTVVLTNITHDHLDYHKTFQEYRDTKMKLFSNYPPVMVINNDDESAERFLKLDAEKKITYGINKKSDLMAKKIFLEKAGSIFALVSLEGQIAINLKLPGRFNIYNALAAAAVAFGENISIEKIKQGLERVAAVRGRMEMVDMGQKFAVIIDFAHTPDGLKQVFEAILPTAKGKIIHVGGATGNRDKTKRPILGAIAGSYADVVIVTNEDPYNEEPEDIIEEVAKGVVRGRKNGKPKKIEENFFKIINRKLAIEKALSMAEGGDIVLITGKGGETKMAVGDKFIPWSDKKIVEEYFKK